MDPEKDVTTIKVDLILSTLKPLHVKGMTEIYEHFKQDGCGTISNGWKTVKDARNGIVLDFNPFA